MSRPGQAGEYLAELAVRCPDLESNQGRVFMRDLLSAIELSGLRDSYARV
jgi:hypothetical protein